MQPYPKSVPPRRNVERAAPRFPIWPCTRWGFPCLADCSVSGGLLPRLFTLTRSSPSGVAASSPRRRSGRAGRFVFCGTVRRDVSQRHLPPVSRKPTAGVKRHRALWCSDFPPLTCVKGDSPPIQDQKRALSYGLAARMASNTAPQSAVNRLSSARWGDRPIGEYSPQPDSTGLWVHTRQHGNSPGIEAAPGIIGLPLNLLVLRISSYD